MLSSRRRFTRAVSRCRQQSFILGRWVAQSRERHRIQAPADHETGDGREHSRDVDALSVRRRSTRRCEVDVPKRSRPARDDSDRQRGIVCRMDRPMTEARPVAGEVLRLLFVPWSSQRPQIQMTYRGCTLPTPFLTQATDACTSYASRAVFIHAARYVGNDREATTVGLPTATPVVHFRRPDGEFKPRITRPFKSTNASNRSRCTMT